MQSYLVDIHHVTFIVEDIEKSIIFYKEVLGLEQDHSRPDMSFSGVWLNVGVSRQIHLMELPNPDPLHGRPEHGGRDRHAAFHVINMASLEEQLVKAEIPYTKSSSGRAALFVRDPDMNTLELIELPNTI